MDAAASSPTTANMLANNAANFAIQHHQLQTQKLHRNRTAFSEDQLRALERGKANLILLIIFSGKFNQHFFEFSLCFFVMLAI